MPPLDVSERWFEGQATEDTQGRGDGGDDDLAATLDGLLAFVRRYVVLSDEQAVVCALWVVHTHAFAAAEATPYLSITSAEKRSGKSRLLEVLELLVARPLKVSGTTAAALARAVSQEPPPTLLLDESDNTFRRDREYVAALMGILNDGYRRGGQTLLCLPPKWEVGFLPVFAPKAIAGIGTLPDTVADRSVAIRLERRMRDERIERFRRRGAEEAAEPLRLSAGSLGEHHAADLASARPALPDELDDRAQDVWEPLLALADLAGGRWPEQARSAALALSGHTDAEDDSLRVRLLADVREAYERKATDRFATKDLLAALAEDEEAPWADYRGKGRRLSPSELAELLRPFGVRSRTVRLGGDETPKGFLREQFAEVFERYLPAAAPPVLPPQAPQPPQPVSETASGPRHRAATEPPQAQGVAGVWRQRGGSTSPLPEPHVAGVAGGTAPELVPDGPEWERAWHRRCAATPPQATPEPEPADLSEEEAAAVARHPELFPPGTPVSQIRDFLPSLLAAEAKQAARDAA